MRVFVAVLLLALVAVSVEGRLLSKLNKALTESSTSTSTSTFLDYKVGFKKLGCMADADCVQDPMAGGAVVCGVGKMNDFPTFMKGTDPSVNAFYCIKEGDAGNKYLTSCPPESNSATFTAGKCIVKAPPPAPKPVPVVVPAGVGYGGSCVGGKACKAGLVCSKRGGGLEQCWKIGTPLPADPAVTVVPSDPLPPPPAPKSCSIAGEAAFWQGPNSSSGIEFDNDAIGTGADGKPFFPCCTSGVLAKGTVKCQYGFVSGVCAVCK